MYLSTLLKEMYIFMFSIGTCLAFHMLRDVFYRDKFDDHVTYTWFMIQEFK